MQEKIKVGVVTLGCDKNRVDTEIMLGKLVSGGYEIVGDESLAQIIIINTCAFIEAARKEAIDTVLQMRSVLGAEKKIVVTGCLTRKHGKELFEELTEADCIFCSDYSGICEAVARASEGLERFISEPAAMNAGNVNSAVEEGNRILTTPAHLAYLRIADGCDNYCSYCTIPSIRGRFRSRTLASVVSEARELAERGVKELILVAQDVTRYGADFAESAGKPQLLSLLTALVKIEKIWKIRLLYCYPELVTRELLEFIAQQKKVAKYIDIPLQHIDGRILRLMNRKSSEQSIRRLFEMLRRDFTQIAVRSTFICGFPSENIWDFLKVKRFLRRYKLTNVGFFAYSAEEGTAAQRLDGQLPQVTKDTRVQSLYRLQRRLSERRNRAFIGREVEVIIDKEDEPGVYIARTEGQCPDVDGEVVVYCGKEKAAQMLEIGSMQKVQLTACDAYNLYAIK